MNRHTEGKQASLKSREATNGRRSGIRPYNSDLRLPPSAQKLLEQASASYRSDRYLDTLKLTRKLDVIIRGLPENLELMGLAQYRLGRYRSAFRTLKNLLQLTGDPTQLPVLMDCARAMGDTESLERLWLELRKASPGKDIMAEGRLVWCGYLGDCGRFDEAIGLLERALKNERDPKRLTAVRQRYLLGVLYENQGNIAGARAIYEDLVKMDPNIYDVAERLASLK